ncbi:MAG: FAD-dependent oxidoreductase [Acidobacteria bacterium]|nr:FAD-dependent oxidoreductase [Acidobacteriota bacterium]
MNRAILLTPLLCLSAFADAQSFDLVVYGGTAGGVITAVRGAREGLSVALLEPGSHLGGMATGGLSRTDFGKKEVIGGDALEFYWRVGRKYEIGRYAQDVAWFYEPKIGEQVLREMLAEAKVRVLMRHRLREKTGVRKQGQRVVSITTEDGAVFAAKVFADCSYEGDLMAQAGVEYAVGRESAAQYGESLAGVRDRTPYHQFLVRVSPYDANGKLLPEVDPGPKAAAGSGDRKVQAYNFRMILSEDPANSVAFPKPPGYDPKRYELMARLIEAQTRQNSKPPVMHNVTLIARIPNRKADINNQGAFSTDYIGKSWDYPDGSYAVRERIWRDHVNYTKGYFYFLAHDPRVPASLQKEVNGWGLAKDEFTDNENWPHQLYIREARRMVGEYVMSQRDIQTDLTKSDAIGMGSYNSDSHNIQRLATADGAVENEGDMQVSVTPYQIPFRMILPKRGQAANLLVPVCFSASHVAYSTLRMEPQYMIIGQAAAVAAAMAVKEGKAVQDVNPAAVTSRLKELGTVLEWRAPLAGPAFFQRLFKLYGEDTGRALRPGE